MSDLRDLADMQTDWTTGVLLSLGTLFAAQHCSDRPTQIPARTGRGAFSGDKSSRGVRLIIHLYLVSTLRNTKL
jgi:hypothetical protein